VLREGAPGLRESFECVEDLPGGGVLRVVHHRSGL
jgi:hypothetical protein